MTHLNCERQACFSFSLGTEFQDLSILLYIKIRRAYKLVSRRRKLEIAVEMRRKRVDVWFILRGVLMMGVLKNSFY